VRKCVAVLFFSVCAWLQTPPAHAAHRQETGFLNRTLTVSGVVHHYQVYVPEDYDPKAKTKWPVILFLHGSGERGSEGMDETQIGLPAAIRVHPERWPAIVVMPQVPFNHHHWTDPDMMAMAMQTLAEELREFHGDPERTYLTGMSLGGYGVWEIARAWPHVFAAIVPVCGGVFWSYQPDRWQRQNELPEEYARVLAKVPAWLFHGLEDKVVVPRQSELMFDAMRNAGANVRLWEYEHVHHAVWERAYSEPELPRWLFAHHLGQGALLHPAAEHVIVPVHPVPAKLAASVIATDYTEYEGEYMDQGVTQVTVYKQGEQLFQRNRVGDVTELLPESATTFFFPSASTARMTFERDGEGNVRGMHVRDDRHEEFWEKRR
jgi:poly(3-hydroxybutyrate) depolymerase